MPNPAVDPRLARNTHFIPQWLPTDEPPFKVTTEDQRYGVAVSVRAVSVGGTYVVDREHLNLRQSTTVRDVVDELTYQAKDKIIDTFGLIGHIDRDRRLNEGSTLQSLDYAIRVGQLRTIEDVIVWISSVRKLN